MSRRRAAVVFGLSVALGWASTASGQELKAEVIHWWTSGGESASVKVFADQFKKAGGTWIDTAIAGGVNARTAAVNRVVGGNPPTAMQFNTGKQFDDLIANDLLRDVEDLAAAGKWKSVIPAAFVQATSRNDRMYAVPVNIHGQNWLWYSLPVLEKAGAKPPTDWDDIFVTLDKVKAAGFIPLALGGQKVWERALFNTVLLGKGGRKLYEDVYIRRDAAAVASPGFRDVVETYARLRGYIDPGSPNRNWNDSVNLVITGKAAMHVMGDWAKGEFIAAGQVPDKDYGCAILGKEGNFMMGGDVFVFTKTTDADQIKAQDTLAKVLLDPETQIQFAMKKGSVPIRLDVDATKLDVCAQKAMKSLADPKMQVAVVEMLSPPSLTGALEDVISLFWNTPGQPVETFVKSFGNTLTAPL